MADEPLERRRMLGKAIPFVLNTFWQAHTLMSPVGLASAAVDQYQRMEKVVESQQRELENLFADIGQLDLQIEGTSRISLSLSRDQLLILIGNYLNSTFIREGNGRLELANMQGSEGFDAILNLPSRSVFVMLRNTSLDGIAVEKDLELAKSLNPSEVWIFGFSEQQRMDVKLDPVFVGENTVLRGRFRIIPVSDMLKEVSDGKFKAYVQSALENGRKARFLLVKNT
ncbi:MAG: hypothetical protein JRN20_11570 [Nitrososphaerota archaeon]|nr:hypothetical protein [Nitrososphaerota archaeon]